MFGFGYSKNSKSPPPDGISELIICVFDDRRKVHYFYSTESGAPVEDGFLFLNDPKQAFDHYVLSEAIKTYTSTSIALSYGEGRREYLYVLPYERKRGHWRFVCVQVTTALPVPDAGEQQRNCALAEDHVCLVLTNPQHEILAVSPLIPATFGYTHKNLKGTNLKDLLSAADVDLLADCRSDTNESLICSIFQCMDGSKRDVEVMKFSAADQCTLYGLCDVSPRHRLEEFAEVSTRERRRIGQDLHDSLGQMLTGISLLSRSLANSLKRAGNAASSLDAAQISGLADDASNQIRQISRGLMPSDIVEQGLFSSLRDLARITTQSCGLECATQLDERVCFTDGAVETHLFRIAQEAVNNAVRHADATQISIVILQHGGHAQLEIRDNGSWREGAEDSGGIGMKTMQYRASMIGGQLDVGASKLGGTHVVCRLEDDNLFETKV